MRDGFNVNLNKKVKKMNSIYCPGCNTRHTYDSVFIQDAISTAAEWPASVSAKCNCGFVIAIRVMWIPAIRVENGGAEMFNPNENGLWNG